METFRVRTEKYREAGAGELKEAGQPLATKIAAVMEDTAASVKRATGVNINEARFGELPAGILGQYDLKNNRITLSEAANDPEKLRHVAIHESFHKRNHDLADERVQSVAAEEALTEMASKKYTGKTIAYANEIQQVVAAANRSGQSVSGLAEWYRNGRNDKINAWLSTLPEANDEDYSLAA